MPKGNKDNYKIYAHINKMNGKVYIGQTCMKNPNYRWRSGKGYSETSHFGKAIKKYGWDNFEHIIIFDHLSLEIANIIEEELIKKFKTQDPLFGYNVMFGGNNKKHTDKTKEKLRKISTGKKYTTERKEKMSKIVKLQWESGVRTKHKMTQRQLDAYAKKRGKAVYQYDKDTLELIAIYPSQKEAERQTGISQRSIGRVCLNPDGLNQSAGGFVWRFENDLPNYRNSSQKKVVLKCDLQTNQILERYECSNDAAKSVGVNRRNIVRCCQGKQKTSAGFKWYFEKDYIKGGNVNELFQSA